MPVSALAALAPHWRSLRNQLLDLLFPPRCVGCQQVGAWLCAACLNQVPRVAPPFCSRCGDRAAPGRLCARCQTAPLQIERIRSAVYFEGALRDAMHHLKYRGRAALAEPLGELMAGYWTEHPLPADVVVPVPLHADRLRQRGYNQAALLARALARRVNLPVDEKTLIRQRTTASQVDLNAQQRRENVRAAFRCTSDALAGKRVLLVDDVCTTGATLEACALALTEGRVDSVQALTLARAL